ncbi:DUF2971 domain-containing protein [Mesorhizobium sp. M1378]|uniref:DUF2971 domain-containing protein n=1 Tax=Mesorhizobium sp. M1378 TaxID=2957092 RepID=UPI0033358F0D
MTEEEIKEKITAIFNPSMVRARDDLFRNSHKLVHYTSAEVAIEIIRHSRVWMRSTLCMNDLREVQHGMDMMRRFFAPVDADRSPDLGQIAFLQALNEVHSEASERSLELLNGWARSIEYGTFITCISEHPSSEDAHGRLSMWRAYGKGSVGVALVLNPEPFRATSDALKAYAAPVSYLSPVQFVANMHEVTSNIQNNKDFLKTVDLLEVVGAVFNMFLFGVTCNKHPGFGEEREWRLIHVPVMHPSPVLERSIKNIAGVPQPVYEIPLKNRPDEGLVGIEIPELIERLIIGPTEFPLAVQDALISELAAANVPNAAQKVFVSAIPLRPQSR